MKKYKVEDDFEYKGHRCVVTFGDMGYRCGYVGLSEGSKFFGQTYDDLGDIIDCHGGLTYSRGGKDSKYPVESDLWWIGFDCGHCWDGQDLETAMKEFPEMKRSLEIMAMYPTDFPVCSIEYVQEQCKKVVDQLLKQKEEQP